MYPWYIRLSRYRVFVISCNWAFRVVKQFLVVVIPACRCSVLLWCNPSELCTARFSSCCQRFFRLHSSSRSRRVKACKAACRRSRSWRWVPGRRSMVRSLWKAYPDAWRVRCAFRRRVRPSRRKGRRVRQHLVAGNEDAVPWLSRAGRVRSGRLPRRCIRFAGGDCKGPGSVAHVGDGGWTVPLAGR